MCFVTECIYFNGTLISSVAKEMNSRGQIKSLKGSRTLIKIEFSKAATYMKIIKIQSAKLVQHLKTRLPFA